MGQPQGDLLRQPGIAAVVVGDRADGAGVRIEVDLAELVAQHVFLGQRRRLFRLALARPNQPFRWSRRRRLGGVGVDPGEPHRGHVNDASNG